LANKKIIDLANSMPPMGSFSFSANRQLFK